MKRMSVELGAGEQHSEWHSLMNDMRKEFGMRINLLGSPRHSQRVYRPFEHPYMVCALQHQLSQTS